MNLKCFCLLTRKRCYRYRITIVFWIIAFVCLSYYLTLYQTISKQKASPFELKAEYNGKSEISDQLLKKVRKIKGVGSVSIVKQTHLQIVIGDYKIDTPVLGVDAQYLNVAFSQGAAFHDEDSSIKLIVNKAALKALMDSEDEGGAADAEEEEPKHQDLSKEKWLKKTVRIRLSGADRFVSGSICGVLKEDKKTPLVYISNHSLNQLLKGEKKSTKKHEERTIYIRTQNIGTSQKVSTSVERYGFTAANLNPGLISNWNLLSLKGDMYVSLALLSYLAGLILIRILKRLKRENEQSIIIHMREVGMSFVDLYHIRILEVFFVTVIAVVFGVIALIILQNIFYVVKPLTALIGAVVLFVLNIVLAAN